MRDENQAPPETNQEQENNGYDISKMLEMAKLFSSLMNHKASEENKAVSVPVINPSPVISPNATILFDETIHTPELKVVKAAIPYFEPYHQKILGVFVKAMEFKRVIDMYYKNPENPLINMNLKSNPYWKTEMLNSFKPHCSHENQYLIDIMVKVMDIGELMKKIQSLKIAEEVKKIPETTEKKNTKQKLIESLSPLLDDNQKQMLNLFSSLIE